MAEVIRMPLLSDTMTEGKIVTWNKKVGDKVKADDVLADVETDKATMEVNGYVDGTLLYIGVPAGQAAKVNQIIAIIGKEGEAYESLLDGAGATTDKGQQATAAPAPSTAESAPAATAGSDGGSKGGGGKVSLPAGAKEIRMPLLSDTMTEGKIVAWNKKVGDKVKADDVLADVETDKATMEVVGYEEGTLLYVGVEAGKAAKINEIIAIVGKPGTDVSAYVAAEKAGNNGAATTDNRPQTTEISTGADTPTPADTVSATESPESGANTDQRIKASPLAKKLAAEKGIDLSKVSGSGDNGRVTKKDVDGYTPSAAPATTAPAATGAAKAAPTATVAAFTANGQEGHTDVELTQMRKVIARRLGESMFTAPHFYLTMDINMDNAITARAAMNEVSPVKISFNDMVIKACATALRQHPAVNSSWMGDFIRQNQHIHVGSALALPEGLIVPVIRFADQKTLSQIAADAKALYAKAKDKKLQPAEFTGNTFTVSNLGMMDIEQFTAIINPPDSAIMAVGAIKEVVVKKGDGFGVVNIMKVTLSCDHRSVDGAVGAAFLQTFKKYMENPVTMLV
ncbi:pyruvate dehydrogenase complex dihydrolipoamide acetyltransferase [Ferruginibacter sp. HRS2-29]|uniref:pyruvate dehydrogenase complex dihydrolipoamide acetyltransferase n=1 Tax=Ferruginibacter sp. HRS2-29 TaxID=2487334 RepID=UPI0020CBA4FC|nr:pyruvate dehydrogenase complex dihydrolipoamide acetyltransferase [Ferruginibacter sp. HRS2-29]MCP9752165.1 pyruvate dehydrogenase complex dihydrolipoamide acetyltransferase [Ferruginibacter sp. HRS2-29]